MPTYRLIQTSLCQLLVVVAILAMIPEMVLAQGMPGSNANEPVQQILGRRTSMVVTERFSKLLKHQHMIKTVDGFDPEVISVSAIDQYTLRVQARAAGVTNLILVDEFDNSFEIEVFIEGDVRHLQAYIKRLFPESSITAVKVAKNVVLRGWVANPDEITEIMEVAREFFPEPVNQMKLGGPNQVQLKVKVMEVQRSKIRQLGFNWTYLGESAYVVSTPGSSMPLTSLTADRGTPPLASLGSLSQSSLAFGITDASSVFTGFLQALKQEGLLKILAEPIVVTTSGRPANLLAGGEFPILVPQSLGTVSIQWREFGVRLEAVPLILGGGNLRLEVVPEVSERDFTNAVSVNGFTVPGLTTRRVNTQVEMKFGQTLIIGGLIASRNTAQTDKLPYLGDLPWVGAAFRRMRFDEVETELLITVTPELVYPVDNPDCLPAGPGSTTENPTDRELYWQGLIEVPTSGGMTGCPVDQGVYGMPSCDPGMMPQFSSEIPAVQGEVHVPTTSVPYDATMMPSGQIHEGLIPPSPSGEMMSPSGTSMQADPWGSSQSSTVPPQSLTVPSGGSPSIQPMSHAKVTWVEQEADDKGESSLQVSRYRQKSSSPGSSRPVGPASVRTAAPDPRF